MESVMVVTLILDQLATAWPKSHLAFLQQKGAKCWRQAWIIDATWQ